MMTYPVPKSVSQDTRIIIERFIAIILILGSVYYLGTFPVAAVPLVVGALTYLGLLIWRPSLWLALVPALLPLLYLTPWSGRFYLDEFDALVLITMAGGLWTGHYAPSFRSMHLSSRILLLAFVTLYLASLLRGLIPLAPFTPNSIATYYSQLNGLRMAKGLFFALLLYPLWVAERRIDRARAQQLLVSGLVIGALGVFVVVLWERGIFQSLIFWINIYGPIQALLNFSTEYRVTAMFAEMHTGGTAIDGYLLLIFPFAALALFNARSLLALAIGVTVFFGTLYVSATTFSRGVYLGVGAAVLATTALTIAHNRNRLSLTLVLGLLVAIAGTAAVSVVAFRSGGMITLVYALGAFLAASGFALFSSPRNTPYALGALGVTIVTLIILATRVISEKGYEFIDAPPFLLAASCILIGAGGGLFTGDRLRVFLPWHQSGTVIAATALILSLITPSLFGYRMDARLDTAKEDLLHRLDHWRTAVEIMDNDLTTVLFGQGIGRFPETFYWRAQDDRYVGGFKFEQEGQNLFLRYLDTRDIRLGQRISLRPQTDYRISMKVRTDTTSQIYLRVCHRHLIHPTEWNPLCETFNQDVPSTNGRWENLEFRFNTGEIGSLRNTFKRPLVLTVSNRRTWTEGFEPKPRTILDIDDLSVRDNTGNEAISNGDFQRGIDRWFAYYDFNHLPWHIKNIWVHVYFELGAVGLGLFILLLIKALITTGKASRDNGIASAIFIAFIGFLAVGTFGTLIDSPRIAFLFYLLLLIGLGFGHQGIYGRRNSTKRTQGSAD